jgi:tetrathionate reductase subunit B
MKTVMEALSRRQFMKFVSKIALVLTYIHSGVFFLAPRKARGAETLPEGYKPEDHNWCMSIDIDKCIGCGRCVAACKAENGVPDEPCYFRTWVERYGVRDGKAAYIDSPNGGKDGFPPTSEIQSGDKSFFVPKLCNHCENSPCVQVCPTGATFHSPDGVTLVDTNYCIGCRFCIQACPYGCRFFSPVTQTAEKCTLCYHRITRGLLPACVEVCPNGARKFGDLKDPDSPIHAFLADNKVEVLKPYMGTHPKVYYANLDSAVK